MVIANMRVYGRDCKQDTYHAMIAAELMEKIQNIGELQSILISGIKLQPIRNLDHLAPTSYNRNTPKMVFSNSVLNQHHLLPSFTDVFLPP